jgi:hypothetical protein
MVTVIFNTPPESADTALMSIVGGATWLTSVTEDDPEHEVTAANETAHNDATIAYLVLLSRRG